MISIIRSNSCHIERLMKNIILKTKHASIIFKILSIHDQYINFHMSIEGVDTDVVIEAKEYFPFLHEDIERLLDYFDNHVRFLIDSEPPDFIDGISRDSEIFCPLELSFQLQALDGDFESKDDGCFSILFMIRNNDGGFWGIQSTLDILDLNKFTDELRDLIKER